MPRPRSTVVIAIIFILFPLKIMSAWGQAPRRLDQIFEGQMQSAVDELKTKCDTDSVLQGRRVRAGKFVAPDLPDSHFEIQFERSFKKHAGEILDDNSPFVVSGSYRFVTGTEENVGLKVVQFTVEIKDERGRVLQAVTREINNTDDIAKIVGVAVAPPDNSSIEKRNQAVEQAVQNPDFKLREQTRVHAPGHPDHAVEIRVCRGGVGAAVAEKPTNSGGRATVNFAIGDTFEVVLFNESEATDAVAVVSIEGLDVLNAFSQDETVYDGYVVPRGGKPLIVPGWLRTSRKEKGNVLSFVVNELGKGAAAAIAARGTRGAITVQFFEAVPAGQQLPARSVGKEVGVGKPIDVEYTVKPMTRRDVAIATVTIHYSENLP